MSRRLIPLTIVLLMASASRAEALRVEFLGVGHLAPEHDQFEQEIGGLSGLAFDASSGHWLAVSDSKQAPRMIEMKIEWNAGELVVEPIRTMPIECGATDAEGIAMSGDGQATYHCFEQPPAIARMTGDGECELLDLPADVVEHARPNRSFESVALVERAGGIELWAAVENALFIDGDESNTLHGTRCRVLIYDAESLELKRQATYETEPKRKGIVEAGSFNSLADAAALPDGRVLFLERGFALPRGVYVQLFVCDGSTIDDAPIPTLSKSRVCDLHKLGLRWLGNLEAMALGRERQDEEGGRLLILLSDDNFGATGEVGTQVVALRLFGADRRTP